MQNVSFQKADPMFGTNTTSQLLRPLVDNVIDELFQLFIVVFKGNLQVQVAVAQMADATHSFAFPVQCLRHFRHEGIEVFQAERQVVHYHVTIQSHAFSEALTDCPQSLQL